MIIKVIGYIVVIAAVFYVYKHPAPSGDAVRHAFDSLLTFFGKL